MSIQAFSGLSLFDSRLIETLPCGTDSRKKVMIALAAVLACVINGDTLTSVLRQATWLALATAVLIIVYVVATYALRSFGSLVPVAGGDS